MADATEMVLVPKVLTKEMARAAGFGTHQCPCCNYDGLWDGITEQKAYEVAAEMYAAMISAVSTPDVVSCKPF